MDERAGTESTLRPVGSGNHDTDTGGAQSDSRPFDRSVLLALVDQHVDTVIVVDDTGTIVYANHGISRLGWTADDLVGTSAFDYVHPDDVGRAAASAAAVGADARPYPGLVRLRRSAGGYEALEVQTGSITADDGVGWLVFNVRDSQVNEAHWLTLAAVVAGEPVSESLRQLATGLSTDVDGPMGIAFDDGDGRCVVGTVPPLLVQGDETTSSGRPAGPFAHALSTGEVTVASVTELDPATAEAARALGLERVVLVPVPDVGADRPALMAQWPPDETMADVLREALTRRPAQLVRLILQRRADQARLEHMALHDELTGLANRAQLFGTLERVVAGRVTAALAYLDLDGFKAVNDRFGHVAGDRVLQVVAQRLEGIARGGDLVARLGGDEFAVLYGGVETAEAAEALGRRITEAVVVSVDDAGQVVTPPSSGAAPTATVAATVAASVGVAPLLPGDDPDVVVHTADAASYEAKRAGKGTWRLAAWRG